MALKESKYIWHAGKLVAWKDATVHVLSHALHYGSSVFEGLRVYKTPTGTAIFRLSDHTRRLFDSAKIYRLKIPFDADTINQACRDIIAKNGLYEGAYIRPLAFRGYGEMGVAGDIDAPAVVSIAAWEWGAYLGADGLEKGVDVCVSSWQRVAPNTIPSMAKAGGNYLSSILVTHEARRLGYAEGIALSSEGFVSEGAGENVFIVKDGVIYTPPASAAILSGITRNTICTLAADLGLEVVEQTIPREMLYVCDELFMTGTAAEVTPIRSVDGIEVGAGKCGPITARLQERFFGLFNGKTPDRWSWLDFVDESGSKDHPIAV